MRGVLHMTDPAGNRTGQVLELQAGDIAGLLAAVRGRLSNPHIVGTQVPAQASKALDVWDSAVLEGESGASRIGILEVQ
jgi:hypothetical protein